MVDKTNLHCVNEACARPLGGVVPFCPFCGVGQSEVKAPLATMAVPVVPKLEIKSDQTAATLSNELKIDKATLADTAPSAVSDQEPATVDHEPTANQESKVKSVEQAIKTDATTQTIHPVPWWRRLGVRGALAGLVVILLMVGGILFSFRGPHSPSDQTIAITPPITNAERDRAKQDALSALKKAEMGKRSRKASEAHAQEQARFATEKAVQDAKEQARLSAEKVENEEKAARAAQAKAAQDRAQVARAREQAQVQVAPAPTTPAQTIQVPSQAQVPPVPSQDQVAQLRTMYGSAMSAMRRGEYDRATGITDAMLAISPNMIQAQRLKKVIETTRNQAGNQPNAR